jgi:hypothetical protein
MLTATSRVRPTHHLSRVIDAASLAAAKVSHTHPVRTGDESMVIVAITHHLSRVVDAKSLAVKTSQSAKVSHTHPVGAGDKSMRSTTNRVRPTHHLSRVIDATRSAVIIGASTVQSANISYCLAVEVD